MHNHDVKFFNKNSQIEEKINFNVESKIVLQPLCAIYDKKLGKYLPPFLSLNLEDAKRQFSNLVNYSSSLISRFPEDYSLVHIGDFDDSVGTVILPETFNSFDALGFKKSDSIAYDDLIKETKNLEEKVKLVLSDYDQMKTAYDKLINSKIDQIDKKIELFPVANDIKVYPKKSKKAITKILDTLFNSY